MAAFLLLNGIEIDATTDEQETVMLTLAAGQMGRPKFTEWLARRVKTAAGFEGV